jgi:hypothetical protein
MGFVDARSVPHVAPVGPFTRAPPGSLLRIRAYFSTPQEEHDRKLDPETLSWCLEQRNALYDKNEAHMATLEQQLKDVNVKRSKLVSRFLDLSASEVEFGMSLGLEKERLEQAIKEGKEISGLELFEAAVNSYFNKKRSREPASQPEKKRKRGG